MQLGHLRKHPIKDIVSGISELSRDQVPRLVIINAGAIRFWYHFIGGPTPQGWQRGHLNRIAIAVTGTEKLDAFETLFDETAAYWVSPAHLRQIISDHRRKGAKL
jgi:hypothetical protein